MNDYRTNNESDTGANPNGGGPLGDYAMVFATTDQLEGNWWDHQGSANAQIQRGPFRVAVSSITGTHLRWESRDTFARVSDGLSNQFFIGEKHIPLGRLGKCPNTDWAAANSNIGRSAGDCSYLQTGNRKTVASGRAMVLWMGYASGTGIGGSNRELIQPISRPEDYSEDNVPTHSAFHNPIFCFNFGSWHPGVCPFLLGDGSVRSVAVTTALPVLKALSVVDDGESVALP
jgi:hypothetical protein